jgi:hypothetical protein
MSDAMVPACRFQNSPSRPAVSSKSEHDRGPASSPLPREEHVNPAMARVRRRSPAASGSRCGDDCDGLDLDQEVGMREAAHLDGGTGRQCRPKYSIRTSTCLKNSSMSVVKVCVRTRSARVAPAAASAAFRFSPTWRICAPMSPLPTISPARLRASRPEMKTSLPGTTVTTGAYSTCPPTTRFDSASGNRFSRSIIVAPLASIFRTGLRTRRLHQSRCRTKTRTYSPLPASQTLCAGG